MKFNRINIVAVLCILFSCISAQTWHQLGSYEYYIEESTRAVSSYSDAESRCSNLQATLAVVKTKQVNDFLVGRIGTLTVFPFAFYIGLKRLSSSRYDFQWIDGTHLTSGYSNWYTGEPNGHINIGEECVMMGWVYEFNAVLPWYDIPCTPGYNLRYICQRLVVTTTPQPTTAWTTTNSVSTTQLVTTTVAETVPAHTTQKQISDGTSASRSFTNIRRYVVSQTSIKSTIAASTIIEATVGRTNQSFPITYIVAIAIGGLAFVIIIIVMVTLCRRKIRKNDHVPLANVIKKETGGREPTIYDVVHDVNNENVTEPSIYDVTNGAKNENKIKKEPSIYDVTYDPNKEKKIRKVPSIYDVTYKPKKETEKKEEPSTSIYNVTYDPTIDNETSKEPSIYDVTHNPRKQDKNGEEPSIYNITYDPKTENKINKEITPTYSSLDPDNSNGRSHNDDDPYEALHEDKVEPVYNVAKEEKEPTSVVNNDASTGTLYSLVDELKESDAGNLYSVANNVERPGGIPSTETAHQSDDTYDKLGNVSYEDGTDGVYNMLQGSR